MTDDARHVCIDIDHEASTQAMLTWRGLTETEAERLALAGFRPALAERVRQQAEALVFLALKRPAVTVIAGAIAAGGSGLLIGLLESWLGNVGWLASVLLPLVIGLGAILPDWEVFRLKGLDRRRWAAARLAVLTVQADPAGEGNDAYLELERLALAAADLPSPHDALLRLADELDEAAREAAEQALSGRADLAPDRTQGLAWRDANGIWLTLAAVGLAILVLSLVLRVVLGA